MRLRNIPGAEEHIEHSPYVIRDPKAVRGQWKQAVFGNDHPLFLEIGCGKGQFLNTLAAQHPEINYLGIEKMSSVLLRAVEKREQAEDRKNLFFLRFDAEALTDVFAPGEVDRIYLNFSDPWPKDRHHKRRLTSREFLSRYEEILSPGGIVEFKTDNAALFDFSLAELDAKNWTVTESTRNLHKSPMNEGNVMTEYEEKFSILGNRICKLIAHPADPSDFYDGLDRFLETHYHEEKTAEDAAFFAANLCMSDALAEPVPAKENRRKAVFSVSQKERKAQKPAVHFAESVMECADADVSPAETSGGHFAGQSLSDALKHLDESFSEMLLRKIDEKGMKDSDCYKRALVDRKLFSKIRSDRLYRPSKPTAVAFAFALELPLEEAKDLLKKAGFALSDSSKADVIAEYFLSAGHYDLDELNEALLRYDQPLIGY